MHETDRYSMHLNERKVCTVDDPSPIPQIAILQSHIGRTSSNLMSFWLVQILYLCLGLRLIPTYPIMQGWAKGPLQAAQVHLQNINAWLAAFSKAPPQQN